MKNKEIKIFNSGKELFSTKGFKDTNVSDITKMAGIAVGTFYNYYPSKEKLFMDIFLEENEKHKRKCLEALDLDQAPIDIVKQMLALNMQGMQANPILCQWFNKSVYDKLERLFRDENGMHRVDFLYDCFLDLVRKWQAEGTMRRDLDSEMIMMIFAAIVNIDTHKDEIGWQYFPELLEIITEFVMKGLTDTG